MTAPFSYRAPLPRVAVIGGMMAYFESIMAPGFRDDRRANMMELTRGLGGCATLLDLGLWAEAGDEEAIGQRLTQARADVLLLAPTMAWPPERIAALAAESGLPIVLACGHDLDHVGDSFDMRELCRHSHNVGTTMMGAMLRRLSPHRPPITIVGFLDDPAFHERLRQAVMAAALARRSKGLRLGRLGAPMPGYAHVGLTPEEASAAGLALVDVALDEWSDRVAAVTGAEIADFANERLPRLLPRQAVWRNSPDLDRALRLGLALDRLADDHALDCGAIACRGPFGDGLPQGAISCLATALCATTGRPFAATGDLVTALAMWVGRHLGGATLYCELDAIDRDRDAFLVANTGEGDFAWTPSGGRFAIHDASVHSGRAVPGVVLQQDLTAGPATALGFALHPGRSERLTLIAMEGKIGEPARTALKVTSGWFHADARPAASAFEAWANAGATHHVALSRGALAEAVGWIGMLTDSPVIKITSAGVEHDQ
ncbi:MAG TPA: hypothetical protein PLI13_01760 [Paracoccus sp. (in: a-proteobacteria)]|nr:hypothetical protein [Paracoccus sp. (in: a-proteobacteria)]